MVVIFSAFLVAGSFLFSAVEVIPFKYLDILFFFGGFMGILYSCLGGISKYLLKK